MAPKKPGSVPQKKRVTAEELRIQELEQQILVSREENATLQEQIGGTSALLELTSQMVLLSLNQHCPGVQYRMCYCEHEQMEDGGLAGHMVYDVFPNVASPSDGSDIEWPPQGKRRGYHARRLL